jgi:hypothetical protein
MFRSHLKREWPNEDTSLDPAMDFGLVLRGTQSHDRAGFRLNVLPADAAVPRMALRRSRAPGAEPVRSGAAHHLARLEHLLDQL